MQLKNIKINPEKLKKHRLARGYSQKELAEKLSIDQSDYSRIENGQHKIVDMNKCHKIAEILSVDVEDFLEDAENKIVNIHAEKNNTVTGFIENQVINEKLFIEHLQKENTFLKAELANKQKIITSLIKKPK